MLVSRLDLETSLPNESGLSFVAGENELRLNQLPEIRAHWEGDIGSPVIVRKYDVLERTSVVPPSRPLVYAVRALAFGAGFLAAHPAYYLVNRIIELTR